MLRQILGLFSKWSFTVSIDAKAKYKCNAGERGSKSYQIVSERSLWGRPDHDAGGDNLGKLGLFSIWLLPVVASFLDVSAGLRQAAALIPDYNEDECFGERAGVAA